jgi:hypothetical protein
MQVDLSQWEKPLTLLRKRYGESADPAKKEEIAKTIAEVSAKALRPFGYTAADLANVAREMFDLRLIRLDWESIIRLLLCRLPGRWLKLANNPGFNASTMLLLTDGRIMCQEEGGRRWKALTPSTQGSYIDGTWSGLAPMNDTRRYYASAVLADGTVIVSGGEYSSGGSETNKTEAYNPATDTWTSINPPAGWNRVGDAASAVLADGRLLMGNLDDRRTAIYDPATQAWSAGPTKGSRSSEESWVLMPDGTVVTVQCNSSNAAEKYVPATNTWVSAGTTPVGLIEVASSEIGAGVLMNDGRAFYAGATNNTALYTAPANPADPGTWVAGPQFPNDANGMTVGCKDTPSCLMTNGRVLISAGPVNGQTNDFLSPTYFFEFDGTSLRRVSDPPNATNVPYIGRMMLAPTGEVLYAAQTDAIYAYVYFSCEPAAARPTITNAPPLVRQLESYSIQGTSFNGLSQAVGYGDDASSATNYPLVRIRNNASGNVRYCKTFDHSSMGVATGSALQSTNFAAPFDIELGPSTLHVVANGVASVGVPVTVAPSRWCIPIDDRLIAWLIGSLADGPLWVLGPNGPVPVDPWGPKLKKEATAARQQLIGAIGKLQDLGKRLDRDRAKAAAATPHAADDDDTQKAKSSSKQS